MPHRHPPQAATAEHANNPPSSREPATEPATSSQSPSLLDPTKMDATQGYESLTKEHEDLFVETANSCLLFHGRQILDRLAFNGFLPRSNLSRRMQWIQSIRPGTKIDAMDKEQAAWCGAEKGRGRE